SIMGKMKMRVSSILPVSLSGWFSPSSKSSGYSVQHHSPQPNGRTGTKRKRGRPRIELAAEADAEDSPAGFDVDDAKGLNYEEVALADNIAEHDLAAEDEQTRRSEYSDSVFLLRKRRDRWANRAHENADAGEEEDVEEEEVEEEEEGDEDDEDDEDQNAYKRRRTELRSTISLRRPPLVSSTPAAPIATATAASASNSESQALGSRSIGSQRQQAPHLRTHLNLYRHQRQREPAYNFFSGNEETPHSIRRSMNLQFGGSGSSNTSHNYSHSFAASLPNHKRTTLAGAQRAQHRRDLSMDETGLDLGIGMDAAADQLLRITKANNNNTNNNNNNVVFKSKRRGEEADEAGGESQSESELNEYDDHVDGLRSSNSNLEFYGNLQSSKSIFSRNNAATGGHLDQPAHHNSTWSLTSLSRRRRFNASIYGSTSALSDSRLLSRSANASKSASASSSPFYQGRTTFGGNSANNRGLSQNNLSSSAASSTLAINSGGSSPAHVVASGSSGPVGLGYGMKAVDMKPDSNPSAGASATSLVLPVNSSPSGKRSTTLSSTSRRILNLLDTYSTTLIDAKRVGSTLKELQSSRQQRQQQQAPSTNSTTLPYQSQHPYSSTPYSSSNSSRTMLNSPAAELAELRSSKLLVPTMQQLLERRRLHRVTQSSRDLGVPLKSLRNRTENTSTSSSSHNNSSSNNIIINNNNNNSNSSSGGQLPKVTPGEQPQGQHTNKMRSRLSHQTRKQPTEDLEEAPPPLDLPQISFPAMASVPKFDLVIKPSAPAPVSVANTKFGKSSLSSPTNANKQQPQLNDLDFMVNPIVASNTVVHFMGNGNAVSQLPRRRFSFAEPIPLEDDGNEEVYDVSNRVPRNFYFSPPASLDEEEQDDDEAEEEEKELQQQQEDTPKPLVNGFGEQFKKTSSEWECDMCMVRNKSDVTKCVACESPKPGAKAPAAPFPSAPSALPLIVPSGSGFGDRFKKSSSAWECDACMLSNKQEASKCVACETPRKTASTSSIASSNLMAISAPSASSASGFGNAFKPKANTWECQTCLVMNQSSSSECVACQTRNPCAGTSPRTSSSDGGASSSCNSNSSSSSSASSVISISSGLSGSGSFKFGAPAASASGPSSELAKPDTGFQQLVAKQKAQNWDCDACLAQNDMSRTKCICCEQQRPGSESAASTGASNSGQSAVPKFNFGFAAQAQFNFGFGNQSKDVADSKKPVEPAKGFTFGASKVVSFKEDGKATTFSTKTADPASAFAPPVAATPATPPAPMAAPLAATAPANQFVFRPPPITTTSTITSSSSTTTPAPAPAPAAAPAPAPMFSFGSSAATATVSSSTDTSSAPSAAKPTFSFSSSVASPLAVPVNFGSSASATSSSTSTAAAATTTTTFSSAAVNPATAPAPSPALGGFSFGSQTVTPKPPTTAGAFFFGQSPAAPAPASVAAAAPATSVASIFGATPAAGSTANSSLSSITSTSTTSTPLLFNFGGEKKAEPAKPFTFGSAGAAPAATIAATSALSFGSWPSSNGGMNTSGAALPAAVAPPVVSSSSSATPVFGSSMFGVPSTSISSSSHGNNSPFGPTVTTAAAFGSVGNSLVASGGIAMSAAPLPASVSSAPLANIFGNASATPISASAPVFGSGGVASSGGFGAAAAAAVAASTATSAAPPGAKIAFNFGGAAAPTAKTSFNFGLSNDAAPKPTYNFTGSVTASTPQAGAFNFSANTSAPSLVGGNTPSRVFQFGAAQANPLPAVGFGALGALGAGGGMATASTYSGGSNMFNFNAPAAPQMQMQSTPNANAPFQFGAGPPAPANIFAFNPPAAGNTAQNSHMARRKNRAPNRRLPPR
ncbi:hypothetical protein KR009_008336, partial [Drosophila setifemur]